LAQTLNGMLARLQQDFARLTEFSGDLAHELRTPITNMLTQVQVVLAHPRSNEAYRETLASCAEELQQLAQTVGDLLYLAQAEAPGALPSREPVALALGCGLVTALAIPWVPAGVPILLAAALGAFWGWVRPSEAGQ
jgi:signal transduction histidine kinase